VSRAYRCRFSPDQCPDREPRWRLDRRGDAAVDWACDQHLAGVVEMLQRPHERTELVIRPHEVQPTVSDHPNPTPPLRWTELVTCENSVHPHSYMPTCKNPRRAAKPKP
jgi:hypothetical protein